MTMRYRVELEMTLARLPLILQTVESYAQLISVREAPATEAAEEAAPDDKKTRRMAYADGRRNKGIGSEDLVLNILTEAKRVLSTNEISDAFERHVPAFARSSVAPACYRLLEKHLILKVGQGLYCMPGTIPGYTVNGSLPLVPPK